MIVDALQARLMEPEHVAAFVAEFNAEWNRLQAEVSAHEGAKRGSWMQSVGSWTG